MSFSSRNILNISFRYTFLLHLFQRYERDARQSEKQILFHRPISLSKSQKQTSKQETVATWLFPVEEGDGPYHALATKNGEHD